MIDSVQGALEATTGPGNLPKAGTDPVTWLPRLLDIRPRLFFDISVMFLLAIEPPHPTDTPASLTAYVILQQNR